MSPEQRMRDLMASPHWELNQKYRARTEARNFNRQMAYQKEQLELTKKMIELKKAQIAEVQARLDAVNSQIEKLKTETAAIKHQNLMKTLRANAAIKAFTASLKGSPAPVAAPVAPAPAKSAADALQEMINKRYRLK
ncbi:hypothetical protein HBN99_11395 [Pseudomonas oryzihabitans]|uniref:hypothetical protein n=1 Tax=Pseudomonas oryzihabitans TaxID=47885 RepID=UPI0014760E79|nr:hypothetical protein [Pseudomonas oryzihabitans]NMZ64917.1 hypothetical protein [Pseudomonas oryzihabitans]